MKWFILSLCLLFGCYYLGKNTFNDVIVRSSGGWSGPECLTVIIGAASHNLSDTRSAIKIIATPFYPSVVRAIGRRAQLQYHWDERYFQSYVDRLVHYSSGMYVDWERPDEIIYAAGLEPLQDATQFDSVMFLLTFQIIGWSSKDLHIQVPIPIEGGGTITQSIPLDEHVDDDPADIKDGTILLINEKGETISPTLLVGKRMAYLTQNEESIFAKFDFRTPDHHFLDGSQYFVLSIRGYESDIRLRFPTERMR